MKNISIEVTKILANTRTSFEEKHDKVMALFSPVLPQTSNIDWELKYNKLLQRVDKDLLKELEKCELSLLAYKHRASQQIEEKMCEYCKQPKQRCYMDICNNDECKDN